MNEDQELLDEEEKREREVKAQLERQTHEGAMITDMMRHPGFGPFKKWLDAQATDAKSKWLTSTKEEAEIIRIQAQVYQQVANWFNSRVVKGTLAAGELKKIDEEEQEYKQGEFNR